MISATAAAHQHLQHPFVWLFFSCFFDFLSSSSALCLCIIMSALCFLGAILLPNSFLLRLHNCVHIFLLLFADCYNDDAKGLCYSISTNNDSVSMLQTHSHILNLTAQAKNRNNHDFKSKTIQPNEKVYINTTHTRINSLSIRQT